MKFSSLVLLENRKIRIGTSYTDPDPGVPKTYGSRSLTLEDFHQISFVLNVFIGMYKDLHYSHVRRGLIIL
jgi:hypothetical protein